MANDEKMSLEFVVGEIEGGFPQKYIVGLRGGKLTYAAHGLSEGFYNHRDIASAYGIEALGGGYAHLDGKNGKMYLVGRSESYGNVPYQVIRKFKLSDAYKRYGATEVVTDRMEYFDSPQWDDYKR